MANQLIVIMGLSGSGKSTLAQAVAKQTKAQYIDADDFHRASAKALMSKGLSIGDVEREAWFERLMLGVEQQLLQSKVVLAFSGIKRKHRERILKLTSPTYAYFLKVNQQTLEHRLEHRAGHFAGANFIQSQLTDFDSLKPYEQQIAVLDGAQHLKKLTQIITIEVLNEVN